MRIIVHNDKPNELVQQLLKFDPSLEVEPCDTYQALPDLILKFRPDAVFTIRFAGTPNFPGAALTGEKGPKWIHIGGSGSDHLGQWDASHTIVTNSAGVAASAMAEYTLSALLHFSMDVPGLIEDKRQKNWAARMISPLKGKTLVIVGLGNTGQAVAKLAKAFGIYVIGTRRKSIETPNVDETFPDTALLDILPKADFVVVSVPLNDKTKGLISSKAFSVLKKGSLLVDLSRGGVVSEKALLKALENGTLKGAALDVFEVEPLPTENPLWDDENVLISPHCSSVFEGWEAASMAMFIENLKRYQAGQEMNNVVSAPL